MEFRNVKALLKPLIRSGHEWQATSINGVYKKPKFYLSNIQWFLFILGGLSLLRLPRGLSKDIIGYIMSAFAISVSLFMSLLVSIFDKFEKTKLEKDNAGELELARLIQKKNFFKRFISITSYLVVLSIIIVVLCSFSYIFNLPARKLKTEDFTLVWKQIDLTVTLRNICVFAFRICFNYLLLNYLLLTLFITGSAYDYYMSEMNNRKIVDKEPV